MGDGRDHKENARLVHDAWERKADFWDERMGDGNLFQRVLVGPATERLLGIKPGERVLDVACGNGVFSRRLAALGARVVATDFSEKFIELARARTERAGFDERVEYVMADATDEGRMLALGEKSFDAVVCNMALMDMPTIEPLLRAVRGLLRSDGRFVFSVQHPAFNSNAIRLSLEEEDRDGALIETYSVKVSGYLNVPPGPGAGMPGEPVPHPYFHRPLSELFGACFSAGFVIDGLEEPSFPPQESGQRTARPLSWENFRQIPPVLVARAIPRP
ncbi:MAG TPA: class I SAM-dependent methyltransferase [Rubrobacteraceae bacterium]|nr:class I SAM-dependent methyltransferase [Rubrobacteraceae bacterium]